MNLTLDFVLLIPCFNNQKGLVTSLNSIVYPVTKFEILIVDDGSEVPVTTNNLQLSNPEMVINVIRLNHNQGIVHALNTGLTALKSRTDVKYIARLDTGDTCDKQRFRKQVSFLDRQQEIALVASWARFQSTTSDSGFNYITKTTHAEILKEMHYKCSFIHPSVMFRREVLETVGIYPVDYPHAEDYAFFWSILKKYEGYVFPEKLVNITFSEISVSLENYKVQLRSRKRVVKEFGDKYLHKIIGLCLLNVKLVLPSKIISWLKSAL